MSERIYCHLNYEYFNRIKNGTKKVEIRLFDEKRRTFKVGDNLIFINRSNEAESIVTEIVGLKVFKSFKDLFACYNNSTLGLDNNFTPDGMLNFYSKEDEKKYGVVAIELKLV